MSTTLDRGDYVFQCDTCNRTLETDTSNFEAARNLLRRNGWHPVKNRLGDWDHVCRKCKAAAK